MTAPNSTPEYFRAPADWGPTDGKGFETASGNGHHHHEPYQAVFTAGSARRKELDELLDPLRHVGQSAEIARAAAVRAAAVARDIDSRRRDHPATNGSPVPSVTVARADLADAEAEVVTPI